MTADLDGSSPAGSAARRLQVTLGALTVFGAALGLLGPFGSYEQASLFPRLAYWIGAMWGGFASYGLAVVVGLRVARGGTGWQFWVLLAFGALLASVPQAFVSRAMAIAMWPEADFSDGLTHWYVQTSIVGLMATFAVALLVRDSPHHRKHIDPPRSAPIAADVIALQMEDHYVRIHTAHGSQMELSTLTAAIARLGGVEGLRTHRSWWVARGAVTHIEGTPRDMRLRLVNGLATPVARSAVTRLRDAGWIAGPHRETARAGPLAPRGGR